MLAPTIGGMTLPRIPYPRTPMTPDEQFDALRRFSAVMERRRSVRDFSPEPVPRDLMIEAIRAAGLAPSGAHQQPWTFVLVTDPSPAFRVTRLV